MNERIQELSVEAWRFTSNEVAHLSRIHNRSYSQDEVTDIFEVKFAELMVNKFDNILLLQQLDCVGNYDKGCADTIQKIRDRMKEYFGVEQ